MALSDFPSRLHKLYEIHEWRHASAILLSDYADEWNEVSDVLTRFQLKRSDILAGGKNKSAISSWFDRELAAKGWEEKGFATSIKVDNNEYSSPTHKVDCYKNGVGLEIEWNNKDPFFDRDLNNFRLLFELRTIAVGIIITRCDELQDIFKNLGKAQELWKFHDAHGKTAPQIGRRLGRRLSCSCLWNA